VDRAGSHRLQHRRARLGRGQRSAGHDGQQGERLLRLRQAAGLTQEELAELIGESQSNIAFWEQSDKPPRSDILPKMAEALGVRVEALLNGNSRPERKGGPTGKVHKVFEEVSQLPRRQQEKIIEFVSAFVNQYKQSKE
jgi:transcriptional regulator with XRE-family HTH domain